MGIRAPSRSISSTGTLPAMAWRRGAASRTDTLRFPTSGGSRSAWMRRASDGKSPSAPVPKDQWKYTGRLSGRPSCRTQWRSAVGTTRAV